jgi:hypothetical protein
MAEKVSKASQRDIKIAPPIPVKELLGGSSIEEPDGLRLAEAPIQIVSFRSDAQTTQYAAVVDAALSYNTLLPFLQQASPSGGAENRGGVTTDWTLPDGGPISQESGRLNGAHKKLGESWEIFGIKHYLTGVISETNQSPSSLYVKR